MFSYNKPDPKFCPIYPIILTKIESILSEDAFTNDFSKHFPVLSDFWKKNDFVEIFQNYQ